MSNANQKPLGLMPAPDAATVELLYRNLGNVPPPLEKLRAQYFLYLTNSHSLQKLSASAFKCL